MEKVIIPGVTLALAIVLDAPTIASIAISALSLAVMFAVVIIEANKP